MDYLTPAIASITKAKDIFQKAGKIKEFEQILGLIDMVKKERQNNFSLQEENRQLKEDNKKLEDKLKLKDEMTFSKNHFVLKDGVKICSGCYDDKGKVIRLHPYGKNFAQCPACKNRIRLTESSESSESSDTLEYDQSVKNLLSGSES